MIWPACPRGVARDQHKAQGLVDLTCPVTGRWTCFAWEVLPRLASAYPEWAEIRGIPIPGARLQRG